MLVQHVRQDRLDAVEAAAEIDGEDALPPRGRDVLEQMLLGDAGVVDQQRHVSELPLDAAHHVPHRFRVGDVRLLRDDRAALRAQARGKLLGLVLALDIIDAHGVARVGKLLCGGGADAAGRARDQSDLHAFPSLFSSASAIAAYA